MNAVAEMVILTALAGAAMPLGAILARFERIQPGWLEREFRHSVIAFGGGALAAGVALVLVPEGAKALPTAGAALVFLAGGIAFFGLDRLLAVWEAPASQLAAMLSDFIPEALALGAAYAAGEPAGALLALLIALQNTPEGFNAYREMRQDPGQSERRLLVGFMLLAPLGPMAALAGYFILSPHHEVVGGIMLFAAGGILYLIFQDIAPAARLRNRHAPALGAVLGFMLGLVGQLMIAPQ
ncbi:MAG: divalent cation transporter [Planctomycetota bacterium]|nr:divalent cation transporter [Planctomycetota bacterium]